MASLEFQIILFLIESVLRLLICIRQCFADKRQLKPVPTTIGSFEVGIFIALRLCVPKHLPNSVSRSMTTYALSIAYCLAFFVILPLQHATTL